MSKKHSAHDDPDMRGDRDRNDVNGRMRMKRGDTQAGTIEQMYHVDLGVRDDMRLDTLRELTGEQSIAGIIRKRNQ